MNTEPPLKSPSPDAADAAATAAAAATSVTAAPPSTSGTAAPPSTPVTSATERAAGLTMSPDVLARLKGALPAVASHAVEAIIEEVPSYASARDYLVGNIETAVQVALGTFLSIAARADDPSSPLGPAREASYNLGRGEARSGRSMDALLSAYRIGARVSWRGLSEESVRAGMSAELLARFAEPMPEDGQPLADVVARVARDVLPDCNRLWHPMYVGHQVSAALPAAVWAESLVGALNQSLAVWEMSPTITAIERELEAAFAQKAPYLFHAGDDDRAWDQGVRSFQCSRRADALKLWVAFQRYGVRTLGALYDHQCDLARAMHAQLEAHPHFEPLHEPESNILCFRWIGDGGHGDEALDVFNRELRESYNRSGAGWITATNLDGRRVLRVTIMNPRTTEEDLAEIIAGLDRHAEMMRAEN